MNKIQPGDILCFITSKPHGGRIIGMAEYTGYYDREDEPLIQVHSALRLPTVILEVLSLGVEQTPLVKNEAG